MNWQSMAAQAPQIGAAYEALFAAKRALEGQYPWWIKKPASAVEARRCAHALVVDHLEKWDVAHYRGEPK